MKPGFYNEAANTHFPFLGGDDAISELPGTLSDLPTSAVVDCGFIMGLDAEFEEGVHRVWLDSVRREGSFIWFEFASDAPGIVGKNLVFCRKVDDDWYATNYVTYGETPEDESEEAPNSSESSEGQIIFGRPTLPCASSLLWFGYLVTGDLSDVIGDSEELTGDPLYVESALIRNTAQSMLRSVRLANADRTRANTDDQCKSYCWNYEIGNVFDREECLRGVVRFKAGYNCLIEQNNLNNSITISGLVGAGEGEPCDELLLFEEETPHAGGSLLTGGPGCNETVRTFNGIGGSQFNIVPGSGVTVSPDPENHRIFIDVSMTGLATCYTDENAGDRVEWANEYGTDDCDCGPA